LKEENLTAQENTGKEKAFRCADVGHKECNWQVSGRSEDEIMLQIEHHGRERHSITNFDNDTRNRVRSAIREQAA
jgi:predicted small metal-binding protein